MALIKKIFTFDQECTKLYPNWDNTEVNEMVNSLNKSKFKPRKLLDIRYLEFM